MAPRVVTLEELREQAAPVLLELPGFRPGETFWVRVRPVDLSPILLAQQQLGNPLLAQAQGMAKAGLRKDEIAAQLNSGFDTRAMPDLLDEVARLALAEPTYEDFVSVAPMTLEQKMRIFQHVTGESDLLPFRDESGVWAFGERRGDLAPSALDIPAEPE